MNKVQQEKIATSATGEECKKKTLQRVKAQYELVQILNECYMRKVQHEKINTQKNETLKWCSMKKMEHEKIAK